MPALFISHLCAFRLFDVRPAWVAKPTMIQRKYEIFSSRIRADWGGWVGWGANVELSPESTVRMTHPSSKLQIWQATVK